MTARYHAVLFDFDYTLGDTERGIVASTRYALEQMDLPQPPEEAIRRTIGLTMERSFTALTGSTADTLTFSVVSSYQFPDEIEATQKESVLTLVYERGAWRVGTFTMPY